MAGTRIYSKRNPRNRNKSPSLKPVKTESYSKPTGSKGMGTRIDDQTAVDRLSIQRTNAVKGTARKLGEEKVLGLIAENVAKKEYQNTVFGESSVVQQPPLQQAIESTATAEIQQPEQSVPGVPRENMTFGEKVKNIPGALSSSLQSDVAELGENAIPLAERAALLAPGLGQAGAAASITIVPVIKARTAALTASKIFKAARTAFATVGILAGLSRLIIKDAEGALTQAAGGASDAFDNYKAGTGSKKEVQDAIAYALESATDLEATMKIGQHNPLVRKERIRGLIQRKKEEIEALGEELDRFELVSNYGL